MGMADVNNDNHPDLFLQSDRWHPGTHLYLFEGYNKKNEPVFKKGEKVTIPFNDKGSNRGVILENDKKEIMGFWGFGQSVKFAEYSKEKNSFSELKTIEIKNLPRNFSHLGVVQLPTKKYLFLFTISDSTYAGYSMRGPNVKPYTPEGFWPRTLPKSGIYGAFVSEIEEGEIIAKPLTSLTETYYSLDGFSLYESNGESYIISGTRLGNIHAYHIDIENETLSKSYDLIDQEGLMHRNPAIHGSTTYFKGAKTSGVIISSEGGIYFYKNRSEKDHSGNLVFENPVHLQQRTPELYGSSLVVPNLVDWDGDGDLDLISGTSLGFIYFNENIGNDENPKFIDPKRVKAGGYEIHVQPGYNQDIQGPGESRWGYTCPTVVDWTGNGLPDILTGDSRGKFNVYINTGTKTKPFLEPEHSLFMDGMEIHGTWRVKPGVGLLGGKMAYIILDTDDEFHLYWKKDKYNLTDGGKLTVGDSINIRANFLNAGATGRSKILIVDWDEDGVKDLLVGTPRHATIPEPIKGLPYRLEKNGSSVQFLRNSGTEQNPVYEYPVMLKFKGENILLGQHSCAPTVGKIGTNKKQNIIVGDETGRFIYYSRDDLDWSVKK